MELRKAIVNNILYNNKSALFFFLFVVAFSTFDDDVENGAALAAIFFLDALAILHNHLRLVGNFIINRWKRIMQDIFSNSTHTVFLMRYKFLSGVLVAVLQEMNFKLFQYIWLIINESF